MAISPAMVAQLSPQVNVQNLGGGGQAPVIGLNPQIPLPLQGGPSSQLMLAGGAAPGGAMQPALTQTMQAPQLARMAQPAGYPLQPGLAGPQGPGKGKGGKGGKGIPPGLAKKDPYSLPDGNPWKQIILAQYQQAAAQGQPGMAQGQLAARVPQAQGQQPSPGAQAAIQQAIQQAAQQAILLQAAKNAQQGASPMTNGLPPGGLAG